MIKDLIEGKKTLSFEVFPPKKDDEFDKAYEVLNELGKLDPDFISVTYGAGGSKSKKTVELASYIQNNLHIDSVAHMTCVGNKKQDIDKVCEELKQAGVKNVLALRGDRPKDMTDEQYDSREFMHATDLMEYIAKNFGFTMAGACYPEKHYECFSMETDLNYLKLKQENGAAFLISQLFFDNDLFYQFRERADKKGISIPICAGIMPITSAKQIGTTISLSGSSVPKALSDIVAKYSESPEDMRAAGLDYAIRQIQDLKVNGVDGIHIYTMNKPAIAKTIVEAI